MFLMIPTTCWKNFQVWVLTNKVIFYWFWTIMKKSFFMKFDIFNIFFVDEFFHGWVLKHENWWNGCQKTFLNVCQWLYDELWTLKNSMKFTLVKKNFFENEIFDFHENFFDVMIWLQKVFWPTETIKSLPKTFLQRYYDIFFITQYFLWNFSKTIFTMFVLFWTKFL